ncbi:ABC transporter permease [Prauserella muralis]|uniref:Spermidine/putrescine ABC transporter permease n=1 Tax=Prauserella muralis TaxID=588067 RepID=A0A2V4BAY2_9PSEU|nr:ABC transporter permease [Prauserella muralis]PXY32534.1 spermidine/putrescine ABC transporter permease [Prauserella muralis]TWE23760.1 putative spermidine/putrescine transport system permease protein [Prauserella muralis]
MTTTASAPRHGVSSFFHRNPRLRLTALLSAPMLWLGLAYLGALAALFVTAFWHTDTFTGQVVRDWTLDNFRTLVTDEVYRTITLRTLGIAALVTVIDAVIAFPMAFAMAKFCSPRTQRILVIAVMTPLWASYLVKAYSWRIMLSGDGVISWLGTPFGVDSPGYGVFATVLTLSYLWLPYMILPIYAGLERLPESLVDASGDLGARPWRTFRSVILPLTFPAIVAGSIFTFSLSLGDYIAVRIVGGTSQMLGNVVYDNIGAANNLPFAATVATVPVVIMLVYLAAVRRTGALNNL